jgi:hypothetical protein
MGSFMRKSSSLIAIADFFLAFLILPTAALTAVDLGAPGTNREYSRAISDPTDMDFIARAADRGRFRHRGFHRALAKGTDGIAVRPQPV